MTEKKIHKTPNKPEYDYIVIGSGFGGSVSALRLAEKGYKVLVIESGKEFKAGDFAKSNWNLKKWLWAPGLFCYGIQRFNLLNDVLVLSGSGVGGGSLVYANTLLVPPSVFFNDVSWQKLEVNWQKELAPFYTIAQQMLGVTEHPAFSEADKLLLEYAREIGREEHFAKTRVGVFFGTPGELVDDPYFNGKGPKRTGCTQTGHCMVGCRDGGKNSLDKNYLHLARGLGADILSEHKVIAIELNNDKTYTVTARKVTGFAFKKKISFNTPGIILAAGALGTMELLFHCRQKGQLTNLSGQLGANVRTNSEVLAGFSLKKAKSLNIKGVSITSGLYVDDDTHIEVVRYPKGSDLMSLATSPLVDASEKVPRQLKFLLKIIRHPLQSLQILWPFGWAKRTVILLVMQSLDNYLTVFSKRRWWSFFKRVLSSSNEGKKIPTYIPQANRAAEAMAKKIGGVPQNAISEVLFNIPMTAHILGGCSMGRSSNEGVVDKYHRVFGYDNMYITDGSAMPANLSVNPSLTIMAMTERAMSFIPQKND